MTHYIMRWFQYEHLPNEALREISKKFSDLAKALDREIHESPEKEFMLRRLLESKDCAVRAKHADIEAGLAEERVEEVKRRYFREAAIELEESHKHVIPKAEETK